VKKNPNQHINSLLETLTGLLWNKREARTFRALVALFLSTELKTTLQNIKGLSASTASRFLSCEQLPNEVYWQTLNDWQLEMLKQLPKQGRRGDVLLKIDLTCIEKTGKKIPFSRLFNRVFGIQLVVLHACIGGLSFPLGYRIYKGKGQATTVELALELLAAFPPLWWSSRVVVLADAGFGSSDFINGCQLLGFGRVLVGIRCDRKLRNGRSIDALTKRGEQHTLHDLAIPLWLSWCDVKREGSKRRFFVASTFAAGGAYLARRYRRRWMIESFFKSVKHDFGLKEARLRTKTGIRLWIFLACLAFSLASFKRYLSQQTLNLLQAATTILDTLTDVRLIALMSDCERLSRACSRPLKLVWV
jgi:hypothetical protein